LLGTHAEQIIRSGERTWLTKHGIEPPVQLILSALLV